MNEVALFASILILITVAVWVLIKQKQGDDALFEAKRKLRSLDELYGSTEAYGTFCEFMVLAIRFKISPVMFGFDSYIQIADRAEQSLILSLRKSREESNQINHSLSEVSHIEERTRLEKARKTWKQSIFDAERDLDSFKEVKSKLAQPQQIDWEHLLRLAA